MSVYSIISLVGIYCINNTSKKINWNNFCRACFCRSFTCGDVDY